MEGLWNFGLEKSLRVKSSADDGAWLVRFQREAKTLPGSLCEAPWFWLAGAEESAVINKIPEPLK